MWKDRLETDLTVMTSDRIQAKNIYIKWEILKGKMSKVAESNSFYLRIRQEDRKRVLQDEGTKSLKWRK